MKAPPLPVLDPATGATRYSARVLNVIDGDTIDVILEAGIDARSWHTRIARLRLAHIDAPELRSKDEGERKRAWTARWWLSAKTSEPLDGQLVVWLHDVDKYGRDLATIEADGVDLGAKMLRLGMAEPYEGGKR